MSGALPLRQVLLLVLLLLSVMIQSQPQQNLYYVRTLDSQCPNNTIHAACQTMIGTPIAVFVTRSIKRLPGSFHLEALRDITAVGYCYASLGHRLVYSKRITQPSVWKY